MTWIYTPYAGILHASAIISAYVCYMAIRRNKTTRTDRLALLMFSVAVWAFAAGLEGAAVGIRSKIFWSKMEYLGAVSAPTLFLLFSLEYAQKTRWLKPIYLVLLSIVPVIAFLFTVTNEWHGLIWSSITPHPNLPNVLIYGHGIGYFILISYDYLIIATGIIALLGLWSHAKQPYRRQVGILLLGSLFPFIAGILYSLAPDFLPGLDLTPVSFSLTGVVIAFGILKFQLFDLAPIARDVLIENMDDGILVLDAKDRVVDINPAAQTILGVTQVESLGQPVTKAIKHWTRIAKRVQDNDKFESEFRLYTTPPRYIHLDISSLYDRYKQLAGRLLVLRDITKRRQTETELARTIEELGILNRISLAVTSGIEMRQVIKNLHEQCSQMAPIDIFYVALYNEANFLIQIPSYFENGHYQIGPSRDIRERPGMIGAVIAGHKTIYLKDNISPETRPVHATPGKSNKIARSYLGIPLLLRERVIGVMSFLSYNPDAYSENNIRILERISIQAAIAIENARLYGEVQRMAIIDELTGIYNYRGLMELGPRELERARRFNRPLSVLFFDIDDFREFNNTYSHAIGNLVLKNVTECCRSVLRSVDVLTRFGGDEFVALLPETDLPSATAVAQRLAENCSASKIGTSHGELSVTVSVGVARLTADTPNLAELIDRANRAEHMAKQNKKGVVAVAS